MVPDKSVVDSNEFCGETDWTEKLSEKILIHFSSLNTSFEVIPLETQYDQTY